MKDDKYLETDLGMLAALQRCTAKQKQALKKPSIGINTDVKNVRYKPSKGFAVFCTAYIGVCALAVYYALFVYFGG